MNIPGKCDMFPWVYMSSARGLVIVLGGCCSVSDNLSASYNEEHVIMPYFPAGRGRTLI